MLLNKHCGYPSPEDPHLPILNSVPIKHQPHFLLLSCPWQSPLDLLPPGSVVLIYERSHSIGLLVTGSFHLLNRVTLFMHSSVHGHFLLTSVECGHTGTPALSCVGSLTTPEVGLQGPMLIFPSSYTVGIPTSSAEFRALRPCQPCYFTCFVLRGAIYWVQYRR